MNSEYVDEACENCGVEKASMDATGPCYVDGPHKWVPYEFRQINAAVGRLENIVVYDTFDGPDNIPSVQAAADDVKLVLDYLKYLRDQRN